MSVSVSREMYFMLCDYEQKLRGKLSKKQLFILSNHYSAVKKHSATM